MKLLSGAASRLMARLANAENEAGQLLSELDALDTRLHRAFTAVSIDKWVAYLNVERTRMLEDENQAKSTAGLMKLPALGLHGLIALADGRRPDWGAAAGEIFRERPYEDIRVAVSPNNVRLVSVSGMVRSRGRTVDQVIGYLEREGHKVLTWTEFAAEANELRMAALRGEAVDLGLEEAGSADIEALATGPGKSGGVLP